MMSKDSKNIDVEELLTLEKTRVNLENDISVLNGRQKEIFALVNSRESQNPTDNELTELTNISRDLSAKNNDLVKIIETLLQKKFGDAKSLFLASSELAKTESTFRSQLKDGVHNLSDRIGKYPNPVEVNFLSPYHTLSSSDPFGDLLQSTEELFTQGKFDIALHNICDLLTKELTNSNNKGSFIRAITQKSSFDAYLTKKGITLGQDDPTILPVQRLPRYILLLDNILKKAQEYQLSHPNDISEKTINELTLTLKRTKLFTQEINTRMLFTKHQEIGEIIIKNGLTREQSKETEKELENIINTVSDTIENRQPEDIKGILNKYGFKNISEEIAKKIKHDLYYSKINLMIRKAIPGDIEIHAIQDTATKLQAKLHGYRSTTRYIIDQLNQAFTKNNLAGVEKWLKMLGIDQQKIKSALPIIAENLAVFSTAPKPPSAPIPNTSKAMEEILNQSEKLSEKV